MPVAAHAQQSAMPVVGFLNATSLDGYRPMVNAFCQGLQESGYVEGQNITMSVIAATILPAALAERRRPRLFRSSLKREATRFTSASSPA
jgi:hypothetical protein